MNSVGLWLVKSQTVGSGVSSVTVTGAFSADYDNYKILYTTGEASGGSVALNFRLGAATTNYYNAGTYTSYVGLIGSVSYNNTQTAWIYAGSADVNAGVFLDVDVLNPYLSNRYTAYGGPFVVENASGTTNGIHKSNTSFTDFTLYPSAGTLTGGTISVYGYRKA